MRINVSIDVKKLKNQPKYIVRFCKGASYFCHDRTGYAYVGKYLKEAIRFDSPREANDFAMERFYNMNVYRDKFAMSLQLIDEIRYN